MKKNKKIKVKKETRDEVARRNLREKVEKKEISYGVQLRLIRSKNDYIKNLINGRYFMARSNMIAEQIQKGEIKESIDGCLKSEDFMRAEYAHQKMQAIMSMRTAHFAKLDLLKDFKLTGEDIDAIEEDYYNGKIIREEYDEGYKKRNKAEFIDTSKD